MLKLIIGFLLIFPLTIIGCAPTSQEFALNDPQKTIENADLDYNFINNIDRITPPFPTDGKYQIGDIPTVKGKYTVHKYIIEYTGASAEKGKTRFHDLIVLKTDRSGKILDAYKYTLEWADSPSLALYRMTGKDVHLKPGLNLKALKLAKVVPGKMEPKALEQRLSKLPGEKAQMGDEFAADEKHYLKMAKQEIEYAKARIRAGEMTQSVYQSTKAALSKLQEKADFAWKGHGPEILGPSLKKLDSFYEQNQYPRP